MLGAIIGGLSAAMPLITKGVKFIGSLAKPAAKVAGTVATYTAAEKAIDYLGGGGQAATGLPALPTQSMPALPAPASAASMAQPVLQPQRGAAMTPVASPYGAVYAPPRTWGRQQKIDYLSQFAIDPSLMVTRSFAPPGFLTFTRSDGVKFAVDKEAAKRAGLYKRQPKPLISHGEGQILKKAEKVTAKLRKVATPALKTRGLKITSKYQKPKTTRGRK